MWRSHDEQTGDGGQSRLGSLSTGGPVIWALQKWHQKVRNTLTKSYDRSLTGTAQRGISMLPHARPGNDGQNDRAAAFDIQLIVKLTGMPATPTHIGPRLPKHLSAANIQWKRNRHFIPSGRNVRWNRPCSIWVVDFSRNSEPKPRRAGSSSMGIPARAIEHGLAFYAAVVSVPQYLNTTIVPG